MSSANTKIDPKIVEILRDISKDPEVGLFDPERLRRFDPARDLFEKVSSRSVEISVAERHLVDVYREEVAWLLREAWQKNLHSDPVEGPRTHKHITADQQLVTIEKGKFGRRHAHLLDIDLADDSTAHALELLGSCVGPDGNRIDRMSMIKAAQALVPSDSGRSKIAREHLVRGEGAESMRLLESLLAGTPSPYDRSHAWTEIAAFRTEQGDLPGGLAAYKAGASCFEGLPQTTASWLVLACVVGDQGEALYAGAKLDETIYEGHPMVDDHLELLSIYRSRGNPGSAWDARNLVLSIRDKLGPASRRIANGLL